MRCHILTSRCVRGVLMAMLLLGLTVPPAGSESTPVAETSDMAFTPLIQVVHSPPRWFNGTDGQVHLTYELILTNALAVPVTVSAVEVLDAESAVGLVRLEGEPLLAAMSLVSVPATPTVELAPSTVGAVWFDVLLASEADLPGRIEHRLTVGVPPGLPLPESVTYTGGGAEVDLRKPVVLGAPLVGAGWAALGSCCDGPHRRSLQPIDGGWFLSQRFAIDFNRLDAQNRISVGDPSLNTSYPTYGQPVIAVADATVVSAVDKWPDQIAGTTVGVTLENVEGNHIVLDLGDGRFAFYAHLLPGSVSVQPGDSVTRGQQMAEVGNSGSTDGPHLHFHVMDGPRSLAADGLPYVFAAFDFTGQVPSLAELMPYFEAQAEIPVTTDDRGTRQNEFPLGRDVVTFPAAGTDV